MSVLSKIKAVFFPEPAPLLEVEFDDYFLPEFRLNLSEIQSRIDGLEDEIIESTIADNLYSELQF